MTELNLRADLGAFLAAGRQLHYDEASCEAGRVNLLPLDHLKVEFFPMLCEGTDIEDEDPHAATATATNVIMVAAKALITAGRAGGA